GDAVKRTPHAAGRALGIERPRVAEGMRVEREHRAKRRAVPIERRQASEVFADDVLGCGRAARERVLQLRRRLLDDGERRRRAPVGQTPVGDLRALARREAAKIRLCQESARSLGYERDLRARGWDRRSALRERRLMLRRDEAVADRDRKAAARIV